MKKLVLCLSLVLAFMAAAVQAQTINGSIAGTVTDQTGAVVQGATVTATNDANGLTRTAETDSNGAFRISGLPVAAYNVKVEKAGFQSAVNNSVVANVGGDTDLSFQLQPGSVDAVVQVTSAGEILETGSGQVQKSISQQQILELPGRNSLNGLALLNPGVLPNQNGRPGSGFAVNGNRTRSNNFTIDGANNNDQSLSIPRQNLPPEALEEFTIITNTPKAEFGRNAGSYVQQITRSGTNRFSGSGFYTWAGNELDALTTNQQRTFNAAIAAGTPKQQALRSARSVTVDNSYGFTFGGPLPDFGIGEGRKYGLLKDHSFFFTSIDFNDFRTTVSSATRTLITPLGLQRLQYPGRTGLVPSALNFLLNTFPAANTTASQGSVTLTGNLALAACPAGDAQCNVIPLATYNRGAAGGAGFNPAYGTDTNRYLFKISTKMFKSDNLSFRYLYDKFTDPGQPNSLAGEEVGQTLENDSFTVNDSIVFSPRWLNEARFTFSRRNINFPENLPFAFTVNTGGITRGNTNFPQFRNDKVYELTDNISFTPTNHAFKAGYNLLIYDLNSFFAPNFDGTVSYGSLPDFLRDTNASYSRYAGDGLTAARTLEHGMFIQDDWRVNQDLNLNLGVRYEYVTAPYGFFSNASPDINNIGPRFGVAWNPKDMFGGRMVLRGGFGISYDQVFQNILLNNSRNYPRGVNVAFTNITGQAPYINLPAVPTPQQFTGNPLLLPIRLFAPNTRVRQPMSYQTTVSMQYQLGNNYVFKAEYINTEGRNLVREVESNFGFTVAAGGTGLRSDPTRGSILIGQGIAESTYHAGQFTFEKRASRLGLFGLNLGDLLFNANYTYSSFISESDDVLGGQANRTLPADPRNPKLDRARSAFDQPHRAVINFVLATPDIVSNGNGFARAVGSRILNGWQISAIGTYASGTPFSVLNANNALGILPGQISTVELSQRVSVNPSGIYPLVSTPTSPNANAYFIVNAANSGILGNLGANTERTGDTQRWDTALVKNIRTFGEHQRLQLRMEVFNLFNRRNFTVIPANTIGNTVNTTTFLNLGFTNVTGRTFTFGARYFW